MDRSRTLLLNWIYYYPVGHAVEAFAAAAEYFAANPNLEVNLLLNAKTPVELSQYCSWVKKTYAIDVEEIAVNGQTASCLTDLPREWDYVVSSERLLDNPSSYSEALIRCHNVIDDITTARIWRGIRGDVGQGNQAVPEYIPFTAFKMEPPLQARVWARQFSQYDPLCAVLLGGSSSEQIYPHVDWWIRLFKEMRHAFPAIHFLIMGSTDPSKGRSTTHGYSTEELKTLFDVTSNASNCYNVGLPNQLALLEQADFLVSPHTGFAFLAPSVGTPWLSISGVRWPDPTFARMPFYAVLPKCPEYPCYLNMLPECRDRLERGIRTLCMGDDLFERINEVVAGARLLLDPAFDLFAAAKKYEFLAQQKGVNIERLYTLDILKTHKI